MRYEKYKENIELSKLGLGDIRLPQTAPGFAGPIDEPQTQKIIDHCMALGVNYYDTAYIYHGGKSEVVLGRALSKYPRESFYVADKFNVQANPDYKAQYAEQLSRLQMKSHFLDRPPGMGVPDSPDRHPSHAQYCPDIYDMQI